jgi:hypothetical protein
VRLSANKLSTNSAKRNVNAKFYDIAKQINPRYNGYLTQAMSENILERVEAHIKKHKYNCGDILSVGSTYKTRQYYGLVLVMDTEEYRSVWFDRIWDAVFAKNILPSLKQKGVKYKHMLDTVNDATIELLFGSDDYEDIVEKLKSHGIY